VTRRPWRAVASYRLTPGLRPVVVARCYRATEEGLGRFVDEHRVAGCEVRVWKVEPIPEVEQQLAATPPSPSVPSTP
jgi:hypothetical protein